MIQDRSLVVIADNTGAKIVNVFSVNGKNKNRYARVGDVIAGSITAVDANSGVKKGDKVYAVIVRTRKEMRRKDGSYIRFDENAVVILEKSGKDKKEPKANRVFGPIPREVVERGYQKIGSLAPEVV